MARDDDTRFRPRLSRSRAASEGRTGHRPASFRKRVVRVISRSRQGAGRRDGPARTGRFNARGRGRDVLNGLPRERHWSLREHGMRFRPRRVVVKRRIVKLRGPASRAVPAHLRYLQREGASLDGERGGFYSAALDHADGEAFLERSRDDRHQFRVMVSPEDAPDMHDLRSFTRALMQRLEEDLQTRLDWIAVDHHNTGHPHTHIVIRGVTDKGKILNIAGDYLAHGIRHRASELVTLELGLQSEWEATQKLGREVDEDRFTRIDHALTRAIGEDGLVDPRRIALHGLPDSVSRSLVNERLRNLERMGLAREAAPSKWSLSPETEARLREAGRRGDIVNAIHRAVKERGIARSPETYRIHAGAGEPRRMVGRVIGSGLAGHRPGSRSYLIIDSTDGHVHYYELPGVSAAAVPAGSIVEIGRAAPEIHPTDRNIAAFARANGGVYEPATHLLELRDGGRLPKSQQRAYIETHARRVEDLQRAGIVERLDEGRWRIPADFERRALEHDHRRSRAFSVRMLSPVDLPAQISANAATWLDRELTADSPTPLSESAFGRETREALRERRQWLIEQGLAEATDTGLIYRRHLIAILARRELRIAGERMARARGGTFRTLACGEEVSGIYRQQVRLLSGRYALLERSGEFMLVPASPDIERALGRRVSGIVRAQGIVWSMGRGRGLGLGV